MTGVMVPLDVIKVGGPGNAGPLIEFARVSRQIGIVDRTFEIAFEVTNIDGVKTNKRWK